MIFSAVSSDWPPAVDVQHMLGADGPSFPLNYAGLFFTATLFQIPAVIVFAAIEEPLS